MALVVPTLSCSDGASDDEHAERVLERWTHPGGSIAVRSGTIGRTRFIALRGVARYLFDEGGEHVRAQAEPGVAEHAVREAFDRVITPMVLASGGVCTLHASAVQGPNGVVAFCAESGTGKTTLALELALRGHVHFADDALALVADADRVFAHRWAHRVKPREPHLRARAGARGLLDAPAAMRSSAPLQALCVLERAPALTSPAEMDRLAGTEALSAVLAHAHWFSLARAPERRAFAQPWLALLSRVPAYRLRFRADLAELPAVIGLVERAFGSLPPEPGP